MAGGVHTSLTVSVGPAALPSTESDRSMLFSFMPDPSTLPYSSLKGGPDTLPYPIHLLSEMQDTLAALADKATADEIARERTRDDQPGLPTVEAT
jgi:hypothetical protein